jgi:hypothetical protein
MIYYQSQMYNGVLLTSELVKLAEQTAEEDETIMAKSLNAIDGCAGMRNYEAGFSRNMGLFSQSLLPLNSSVLDTKNSLA